MKDQYSDMSKRRQVIEIEANKIKNAKHIVVIGGGPVGIELMGEICTKFPNKKLTLVSSEPTFMPQMKNLAIHKKATAFFHSYGVALRMGEKVIGVTENFGRYTLATTSEINNKIEADRVYFCAGFIPNTEFMRRNFQYFLDDKTQIKVTEHLRVEGQSYIWAIGDCNNTPENKTAYVSNLQADYWIKNLGKFLKRKKASSYTPASMPPPVMLLSLGPFRGIALAGSRVLSTHKLAVSAKYNVLNLLLNQMNQDKSLMKIDWDKLLTKDIKERKDLKESKGGDDSDEEGAKDQIKILGIGKEEFGFH